MKNKLTKISLFIVMIVTLGACTKAYDDNFNTSYENKMVMINAAVDKPLASLSLAPPATGNIVLDLGNLSVSSTKPNENEITVTIRVNNTLLADYNTTNATNLVPFPTNALVMPLVYKIPAGQKQIALDAQVVPSLIDLSNSYAVGISIVSVTGENGIKINDLYKDCLYAVVIKNKYDGKYLMTGYHNRPPAGLPNYSTLYVDVPVELHTTGSSTVDFFWPDAGDYGHPFSTSPGVLAWYGNAVGPRYTMDPATNLCTSASNRTAAVVVDLATTLNPNPRFTWNATTNKPDKAYIAFRYNANNARAFIDTFTYVGPR